MTKLEVQQRVIKNGKPLELDLFNWDETTNTLYTTENNLCLAFNDIDDCTFTTGYNCTFKTGSECTFKTGSRCTFDTGAGCTFDTGSRCTFDTSFDCTFDTGYECVIVRRDMFEVIQIDATTMLNQYNVKGFTSKLECED